MDSKLEQYIRKLNDIINSEYICEYEIVDDFAIALSLCVIKKMEVYVWGGGTDSYSFIRFLHTYGIDVKRIIDIDPQKTGMSIDGVQVIQPFYFKEYIDNADNAFVFIHTAFYKGIREQDFMKFIMNAGIAQFYALTKEDRYLITSNTSYWVDQNREEFYRNNLKGLEFTLSLLSDEYSCQVMLEYIRAYIQKDVYRLTQLPCRYKYLYDYDREKKKLIDLYQHSENEVWLNCGAYKGDNLFYYFAAGLQAKKIIAVEGDEMTANILNENINRLPENIRHLITMKQVFIDNKTDFNRLLEGEKITLMNADIEGAELSLLKTCKDRIQSDRPVISVCMYHKKEDMIEIPQYIHSIVENYMFYLRKYAAHYGNENRNKELVLYAVPEERAV